MSKNDIVMIVLSVLGTAIAIAMSVLPTLGKLIRVVSDLRLELAALKSESQVKDLEIQHQDERWNAAIHQTIQRFDHFSSRVRGEMVELSDSVRELQNYLAKTTTFEVRASDRR